MDFLHFGSVSFQPDTTIWHLCEELNNMVGNAIWYDTFNIQNTKWLWLVNDIVAAMNRDGVQCCCFELYPSFVAGVLNSVKDINFYVVCNKKVNYADYIKQCISNHKCTISHTGNYFQLSSGRETICIKFEARIVHEKLPSALVFAHSVLSKMRLSSLAYGIVCVNNCVTYITKEVLTSKHDCMSDLFAYNLHEPKQLANCKMYTNYCSAHPCKKIPSRTLFCSKKSHRLYWDPQCLCKLCVKTGPASLKSQCVNKLWHLFNVWTVSRYKTVSLKTNVNCVWKTN